MRSLRVVDPYRPLPRPWTWLRSNPYRLAFAALFVASVITLGVTL